MGKLPISMAMFNSKLLVYQRVTMKPWYKLQYMEEWFPTANLLGFNLWCRGLVTQKNACPEKPEQSWNLAGIFRCWVANLGKWKLLLYVYQEPPTI